MPKMKTKMNHNLLVHTVEKSNCMEYSEQNIKFIARVVEDLRNNTTEKGSSFTQSYFLHKGF